MSAQAEAATAPAAQKDDRRDGAWSPGKVGWTARIIVLVAIFGGVLYATSSAPGYIADRIALAAVWAIIGISLNIVLGYVGQVSLGHHGFIGIGAFVAAYYATEQAGCGETCPIGTFTTATLLAILSGALAAGLLGLVALRIKGLYLALITLAYGFMAEQAIFEIPALTRGGAGMPAPRPAGFVSDKAFAYLCFAILAVVLFIDWRLLKSKAGRAILSVKHSESVAASYGINVTMYKIMAFVLSGVFAGLAGSLLAFRLEAVSANDFQFQTALLWVLMVVVGGLGNRTGVVIGSAFFALFDTIIHWKPIEGFLTGLMDRSADEIGEVSLVLGALLAVLTMVQFQGGIAEQISPITRWLRGEKFSLHPEGHGKGEKHSPLARFKRTKKDATADGNGSVP
ncbi:MAG: branched-chain amino acid ABC transporter permease, partial [Actinomycetota bacterium]|nr:branched-chain amino acid ABC transporter permease [Actinomycetota bacterium]